MGNNRLEMPAAIREIVGVYHADGGVMGELRYILGKARGTAHCALCDITHSTVRRKAAWDDACRTFPHPVSPGAPERALTGGSSGLHPRHSDRAGVVR